VDDASPDGTADAVRALQDAWEAERDAGAVEGDPADEAVDASASGDDAVDGSPPPQLVLVERPAKLGLGTAYAAGVAAASPEAEWVVLLDADLSHPPSAVPRLVDAQRRTRADIVSGTRYRRGGGVVGWDVRRKTASVGANVLARFLLRLGDLGSRESGGEMTWGGSGAEQAVRPSDLTGSLRLYRRSLLDALLASSFSRGYAFQMEVAARAVAGGARFAEVGYAFVDRLRGVSKLGAGEFAGFLAGLARLIVAL